MKNKVTITIEDVDQKDGKLGIKFNMTYKHTLVLKDKRQATAAEDISFQILELVKSYH